jgi:hypothetical protein
VHTRQSRSLTITADNGLIEGSAAWAGLRRLALATNAGFLGPAAKGWFVWADDSEAVMVGSELFAGRRGNNALLA